MSVNQRIVPYKFDFISVILQVNREADMDTRMLTDIRGPMAFLGKRKENGRCVYIPVYPVNIKVYFSGNSHVLQ